MICFSRVGGLDGAAEAAACGEVSDYSRRDRLAGFDDVGQNLVDGIFVEDANIAVGMNIDFERFEFDAGLIWNVGELDGSKIRKAGLWANGGVFWNVNGNLITRILVRPGFQFRQFCRQSAFRMLFGVRRFRYSFF